MATKNSMSLILKWLSLVFVLITMLISAVIWASTEHTSIKKDYAEDIHKMRNEIRIEADRDYAEKSDAKVLQELLRANKEDIIEIKEEQKEQGEKINEIHKILIRR